MKTQHGETVSVALADGGRVILGVHAPEGPPGGTWAHLIDLPEIDTVIADLTRVRDEAERVQDEEASEFAACAVIADALDQRGKKKDSRIARAARFVEYLASRGYAVVPIEPEPLTYTISPTIPPVVPTGYTLTVREFDAQTGEEVDP